MTHRPELKYFTDKADASERTVRALAQAGFNLTLDTNSPVRSAFNNNMGKVEIVGTYQDSQTGNRVRLGMNIMDGRLNWPYNWAGETTLEGAEDGTKPLARGGNNDNSQPEIREQLVTLMASARFGVEASMLPTWTPEFEAFRQEVSAQLDPLYSDTAQSEVSEED